MGNKGGDIDNAWMMMQRMAIAPNVSATDEGKATVDGGSSRFKSYTQTAGRDKVWGTTWLITGEDKFYLVTGMCLEDRRKSEGKELLKCIKGIKLIRD